MWDGHTMLIETNLKFRYAIEDHVVILFWYLQQAAGSRCRHLSDYCVEPAPALAVDGKKPPMLASLDGVFRIKRLAAINCFTPHKPPTFDLGFKVRRKKFTVEVLINISTFHPYFSPHTHIKIYTKTNILNLNAIFFLITTSPFKWVLRVFILFFFYLKSSGTAGGFTCLGYYYYYFGPTHNSI